MKLGCVEIKKKKGGGLIQYSVMAEGDWGRERKQTYVQGKGVDMMKLEKINQWYHLPASLVNTISASYKIFQQLVISHRVVV